MNQRIAWVIYIVACFGLPALILFNIRHLSNHGVQFIGVFFTIMLSMSLYPLLKCYLTFGKGSFYHELQYGLKYLLSKIKGKVGFKKTFKIFLPNIILNCVGAIICAITYTGLSKSPLNYIGYGIAIIIFYYSTEIFDKKFIQWLRILRGEIVYKAFEQLVKYCEEPEQPK